MPVCDETTLNRDLVDPSDFCRECKGTGRLRDHDGSSCSCDMCRGTGNRTILVTPVQGEAA